MPKFLPLMISLALNASWLPAQRASRHTVRTDFTVAAERAGAFVEEALRITAYARGKDGARFYHFFQDAEDPTRFALLSEWDRPADRAAHLTSPHGRTFLRALDSLRAAPERIRIYRSGEDALDPAEDADPRPIGALPEPAAPTIDATRERLEAAGMLAEPFVLFVDVPVREGGAAFLRAAAAHIARATREEPLAIHYGYYERAGDPASFLLFEYWQAFEGMARHVELAHFEALMQAFALVGGDGREVGLYRPL